MKTAIMFLALSLAGCNTVSPTTPPNGRKGFATDDCQNMADVHVKAAAMCGGKYEVVEAKCKSDVKVKGADGLISTATKSKSQMKVRCNVAPAAP